MIPLYKLNIAPARRTILHLLGIQCSTCQAYNTAPTRHTMLHLLGIQYCICQAYTAYQLYRLFSHKRTEVHTSELCIPTEFITHLKIIDFNEHPLRWVNPFLQLLNQTVLASIKQHKLEYILISTVTIKQVAPGNAVRSK